MPTLSIVCGRGQTAYQSVLQSLLELHLRVTVRDNDSNCPCMRLSQHGRDEYGAARGLPLALNGELPDVDRLLLHLARGALRSRYVAAITYTAGIAPLWRRHLAVMAPVRSRYTCVDLALSEHVAKREVLPRNAKPSTLQ